MSDVFVLVPSFNHASFVERTIRSIFTQSLKPRKLLVIDDGSTDNSVRVIEQTLLDCPFESDLIVRENRGLCKTLNEGFEICNQEYFAYLGSDDVWLPSFLEASVRKLRDQADSCLSFANCFLIDENDVIIDTTENWYRFTSGDALPFLLNGVIFSSPGVVYRSRMLPEKPWNENSLLEDYDLYLRLAADYEFVFNPETLAGWRQHGSNTSGNLPKTFPEFLKAHEESMGRLGIAKEERDRLKKKVEFNAAFNFVRHGFKKEAVRYGLGNLGGAGSVHEIANLAFRLLIPRRVFQWNRKRKYQKAGKKYGILKLSQ